MATLFFADHEAQARPGSFDAKVRGASVGLPTDVVDLAKEIGVADTEEFAAYCSVFTQDVAERLQWHEAEVSRAAKQLYILLGQSVPSNPPRFAFGVPIETSSLTAGELADAKSRTD